MEPNRKPVETKVGPTRCLGFVFMGRVNGINLRPLPGPRMAIL